MARFIRSVWNELHGLTDHEIEVIKRFENEPRGSLFVAAADILRKRGYIDEAIVIMEDGVKSFPQYYSARAALGRDYFLKGMMNEALHHISVVVSKSVDNLLAQRLKLKLSLIFKDRDEAIARLDLLKQLFPDDDFTRSARDLIALDDFPGACALVYSELERLGIRCQLESDTQAADQALKRLQSRTGGSVEASDSVPWEIPSERGPAVDFGEQARKGSDLEMLSARSLQIDDAVLPAALRSGATLATVKGEPERYLALKGFRRVQAEGLFSRSAFDGDSRQHLTIESTTLAEIYATQGLYAKACSIYERLLRSPSPSAAHQSRLLELRRLCEEQRISHEESSRAAPTSPPPAIAARVSPMEEKAGRMTPEQEKKLRFLEGLLGKLERMTGPSSASAP